MSEKNIYLKDLADEYLLEIESKCDTSLDKLVFDVIGSFSVQESDFYLSFSLFIFDFYVDCPGFGTIYIIKSMCGLLLFCIYL